MDEKTKCSFDVVWAFVVAQEPELADVVLRHCEEVEVDHKGKWRWHAHTLHIPNTVCYCHAMEELTEEQRQGIFLHELGHLYCERYQEEYPENSDEDADDAALEHFGTQIYYDEHDIEVSFRLDEP